MSVNALRLMVVILLMGLPGYSPAEVDPFKQADNMDAAGRAEEAAETQRLKDYYKAQGLGQAVDAGTAYQTNMKRTRVNLVNAPDYNSDYVRRANAELAAEGAGKCYRRVDKQTVEMPCADNQARGGATVGDSDYVGARYLDASKGGPANDNIVGNPQDNPQNRPTLSLRPNP